MTAHKSPVATQLPKVDAAASESAASALPDSCLHASDCLLLPVHVSLFDLHPPLRVVTVHHLPGQARSSFVVLADLAQVMLQRGQAVAAGAVAVDMEQFEDEHEEG